MFIIFSSGDQALTDVFLKYRIFIDSFYFLALSFIVWNGMKVEKFYSWFNLVLNLVLLMADLILMGFALTESTCIQKLNLSPTSDKQFEKGVCGIDDLFLYIIFTAIALISKVTYILANLRNKMYNAMAEPAQNHYQKLLEEKEKKIEGDLWKLAEEDQNEVKA